MPHWNPHFCFLKKSFCGNQHYNTNAVGVTSTISTISIDKYILDFSVQLCMLFNLAPRFLWARPKYAYDHLQIFSKHTERFHHVKKQEARLASFCRGLLNTQNLKWYIQVIFTILWPASHMREPSAKDVFLDWRLCWWKLKHLFDHGVITSRRG